MLSPTFLFTTITTTFTFLSSLTPSTSLTPYRLRVEYQEDPIGLDVTDPRFSWALSLSDNSVSSRGDYQTAYQIIIYNLDDDTNVDSGKITSNSTTHITLSSFTPISHADYKWCVYVWNSTNTAASMDSVPSSCAIFTYGLLSESDWNNASWIGITDSTNSVNHYFTNEFRFEFDLTTSEIEDINKVRCYIASPNYYRAWLNGEELDQHRLGQFTTFQETCYYDVIDCTRLITGYDSSVTQHSNKINNKNSKNSKNVKYTDGTNALTIMLGQGWYSQPTVKVGVPMFRALIYIEYNSDSNNEPLLLTSDENNWYTHEGPVRMNDIYLGEYYDARYETDGWTDRDYNMSESGGWVLASVINNPTIGTLYSSAIMPQIERTEVFTPVAITQPGDGIYVIDFGQNLAGVVEITIPGNNMVGMNITMQHSEQLYPNGTVQKIYSNTPMIATYTMKGDGNVEIYEPYFTYFGFQYVEIKGFPGVLTAANLKSYFLHSNFDTLSDISFGPSNVETPLTAGSLLNNIQRMTRYASLSNYLNIPTDCPQRERRGWLGDAQLTAEVTIYNFDMPASYTKFLRDIRDAQNFANHDGAIPDCAPYYSHGSLPGDPSWTAALIFITHWMYRYFGDIRIVEQNYDNMQQQMSFLDTEINQTQMVLPVSVAHYGDWCAGATGTDCKHVSTVINTYDYAKQAEYLSEMAMVLNKTSDAEMYLNKSTLAKLAIRKYFFNETKGYFIEKTSNAPVSTLQALCLDLDILSENETDYIESTVNAMVNDIIVTNKNHLPVGIIGVKYVLRELCERGYCSVAVNSSVLTTDASFGYWYVNGATTLWEHWGASRYNADSASKNHIMFGTQGIWYYQYLAGIRQPEDSINWSKFMVRPYYNATQFDLFYIDTSVDTTIGTIEVNWKVEETQLSNGLWLTVQVNVPVGSKSYVYLSRLLQFGQYIDMNDWTIMESISNTTVFKNNAFVNGGSNGVTNGMIEDNDNVVFEIESGLYSLELYTPPSTNTTK